MANDGMLIVENVAYRAIINSLCSRVIHSDDCDHMGLVASGKYDKENEYVEIRIIDRSKFVKALSPLADVV